MHVIVTKVIDKKLAEGKSIDGHTITFTRNSSRIKVGQKIDVDNFSIPKHELYVQTFNVVN